ncbi:MAG: GNAT family N-acetyltransferase [Anaerolineales bacterium]|nr:GNAT family N-acetyltransferase [Anaerolineales bacterium]
MAILANAPQLKAAYTMRPATLEDSAEIADLINACARKYLGTEETNAAEERNYAQTPGFEPQRDARVVLSAAGTIVGHAAVWANVPPAVHPFVWARVHPDHEYQGIGTYLNAWAASRCRAVFAEVPLEARVSMRALLYKEFAPAKALLEELGWSVIRHNLRMRIEMAAPPPTPQWPEHIGVRPFVLERDIEALYRAEREIFRDHFGHVNTPFEEGLANFQHYTEHENFDPSLWFVAYAGDEIAGMALNTLWAFDSNDEGYVMTLGVRRPWRKQGLGLALLQHSFGKHYRRGKRRVALHLDASNLTGALRLYQRAGMGIHRQSDMLEKEIRSGIEIEKTE